MAPISEKFADEFLRLAVDGQRAGEGVRAQLLTLLRGMEQDVVSAVQGSDLSSQRSANDLIREMSEIVDTSFEGINSSMRRQLIELGKAYLKKTIAASNSIMGAAVFISKKGAPGVEAMVKNQVILGGKLEEFFQKQSADTGFRFSQEIRRGLIEGRTNDQILMSMRGQRTGRQVEALFRGKPRMVPEYSGGLFDTSRRELATLVRTGVANVNNNVMDELYQDNEDILRGRQALVTFDLRTSPICRSRSMAAWSLDGEPLPDSPVQIPFPGTPPWHPNCRTYLIPLTKSWEQIIEETTGKRQKVLERVPTTVRSSMDGEVAADQTYDQWLRKRSEEDQKEVLGPGKWELWKKDRLTMAQLVDQAGNPLTIEELGRLN
jgi:hypothetical protein